LKNKNIFEKLDSFADILVTITMYVVMFLTALMVVTVLTGVLFRYVIRDPLGWTEELARYLMIWAALLAVSVGIRKREHVGIQLLVKKLPLKLGRVIILLVNIMVMIFLLVLTIRGYAMAVKGFRQLSLALGISMFWPLMAIPISGALAIIQQLILIIDIFNPDNTYGDLLGHTEVEEALQEVGAVDNGDNQPVGSENT
jgi:TRAP-type C4-dicarboxylate transport system permease small subunit